MAFGSEPGELPEPLPRDHARIVADSYPPGYPRPVTLTARE
jgi:hypothetical protein